MKVAKKAVTERPDLSKKGKKFEEPMMETDFFEDDVILEASGDGFNGQGDFDPGAEWSY